jgi:hypothetical protein|tara:strand:- start:33915 stop:34148 length:234 start_codon:yes stop_codon:yes gene_type:complete
MVAPEGLKKIQHYVPVSCSNFNPQNTQCIPVVKIIAFLELRAKLNIFQRSPIKDGISHTIKLTEDNAFNEHPDPSVE